jgi:O-antigen/teichoic acid export membrane protein
MEGSLIEEKVSSPGQQTGDNFFDTEYLKADLKGRAIRGGAATAFAQGARFILRTGSTVVLARLLTPKDFGLVAMVMAVINFAIMFKDMGLSMATVQKDKINHVQISMLFWINTAIGAILALLTILLAPAIASFYAEPRLKAVAVAMAAVFVFGGLTIQHQALLRRNMRFVILAVIEVAGLLVGVTAAIVAAWRGAGYWSLVFMHVAMAATIAVGVWVASGWRPGWPRRASGARSMLTFGRDIISFRMVNYFARNTDNILLGRFYGSGVLGLYSKAYGLLMLPISQITGPLTAVAMPALSRIQDDPKRYTSYYTKLILLLSFISMPLIVFLAVCSKSVIHLILGEQWLGAGRIFQILAITAFIQPVSNTAGVVMLSLGQSGRLLKFGIVNSVLVVASFVVGIRWGAVGVASAYAVANYLILFPMLWYCFRLSPVSTSAFVKAVARPAIASLVMASVILVALPFLGSRMHVAIIGYCFVIGLSSYFLVWLLMPGGIQILRDFRQYVVLVFSKKREQ